MRFSRSTTLLAWTAAILPSTLAIQLPANPGKQDYINAANEAKENMLTFYNGNRPGGIPGYMVNPDIYFWWLAGGMLGQLIQHWALTGNDTYNDLVKDAIVFQSQDNKYLEPRNQTSSEGNDDQMFWAYAAMDAAEYNFPAPDNSTGISWLGLAQGVFNRQYGRWDPQFCDGGIRWQFDISHKGYNYKNTPTNGGYFQLAARLARFTGNETYEKEAEKTWDWAESQKVIAPKTNSPNAPYHVFDGVPTDNCSAVSEVEFSYNPGAMLIGAAYMYNHTGDSKWKDRAVRLMQGFGDNQFLVPSLGQNTASKAPNFNSSGMIFSESAMEFQTPQPLNSDQPSFKAYTLRWMAIAAQFVPDIQANVTKILQASAQGAAQQCVGQAPGQKATQAGLSLAAPGTGNNWCGRRWYQTTWDGYSGFGEQMSAMSVFQNSILTLPDAQKNTAGANGVPFTANTGGTSVSQPGTGTNVQTDLNGLPGGWIVNRPITAGDRVGAAILTIIGLVLPPFGIYFMFFGE